MANLAYSAYPKNTLADPTAIDWISRVGRYGNKPFKVDLRGWRWILTVTIWLWLTVHHGKSLINGGFNGKNTIFNRWTIYFYGPFSMAMLVITRGYMGVSRVPTIWSFIIFSNEVPIQLLLPLWTILVDHDPESITNLNTNTSIISLYIYIHIISPMRLFNIPDCFTHVVVWMFDSTYGKSPIFQMIVPAVFSCLKTRYNHQSWRFLMVESSINRGSTYQFRVILLELSLVDWHIHMGLS